MEDAIFMARGTQAEVDNNHHLGRQRRFMSTTKCSHTNLRKDIRFLLKNNVTGVQALHLQLRLYFLCNGKTWKAKRAALHLKLRALWNNKHPRFSTQEVLLCRWANGTVHLTKANVAGILEPRCKSMNRILQSDSSVVSQASCHSPQLFRHFLFGDGVDV